VSSISKLQSLQLPQHLLNKVKEGKDKLIVQLLRGLFNTSAHKTKGMRDLFTMELHDADWAVFTPMEILELYGLIFEVHEDNPRRFLTADSTELRQFSLGSAVMDTEANTAVYAAVTFDTKSFEEWGEHLAKTLPIVHSDLVCVSIILSGC